MKASLLVGLGLLLNLTTHAAQVSLADAVEKGESFHIQALLSKDIDVNDTQIDGMTALHWAAHHNDTKLADVLLDRGANASAENRYGITPLYLACLNGNAKLVRQLLDAGADRCRPTLRELVMQVAQ